MLLPSLTIISAFFANMDTEPYVPGEDPYIDFCVARIKRFSKENNWDWSEGLKAPRLVQPRDSSPPFSTGLLTPDRTQDGTPTPIDPRRLYKFTRFEMESVKSQFRLSHAARAVDGQRLRTHVEHGHCSQNTSNIARYERIDVVAPSSPG